MGFLTTFAGAAAVLSALIPNAAGLNVDSKSNVAVYYGQGANQQRLSHFCQESSVDIINIGFINVFPKAVGEWPGSNFGNQCDGTFYVGTQLLKGCHQIWEDIPVCKEMGKTVMLSLGGETAYQGIPNDEVAEWFADFLWYSFGPPGQNASFPRPFKDNQVDGFDFDIEHDGNKGYATMIKRLRSHFANFKDQTFYISGAPQCQIPDSQLGDAIANSHFDFIWVQWYNTAGCSAMDFVKGNGLFNFDKWANVIANSANPNAKLFVGLPASTSAANDGFYLSPLEAFPLVKLYMSIYPHMFGGIMLWEATASENNVIDGKTYAQHMKHILQVCDPSPPPKTTSTVIVLPTSQPASSTPSSSAVQTSSQSPSSIFTPSSQLASSSTVLPSSTASPSSSVATSSSSISSTSASSSASHSSIHTPSSSSVATSSSAIPSTGTSASSSASHSSIQTSSSSPVTGSSSTPVASPSSDSSTSHSLSSSAPVSDKPSTKPTASSSQTSSPSGSSIPTHPGTSTSPAGHSSSAHPGKPNTSTPVQSSSSSVASSSDCSTSSSTTSQTGEPSSSGSTTAVSSSSSSSHGPSRTPTTRTPVSSPPSATSTSLRPSEEPSTSVSSSTASDSTVSSADLPGASSSGIPSTHSQSATGAGSATGAQSTTTNAGQSSTDSQSATGAGSATGAQSTTTNAGQSSTGSVVTASPSVTPIASTTTPPTVTTIIVTSYTDICPTGFTTITTTLTTTICPEATAGVTSAPSGTASTTPSIPEGWTTTVKVCENCAPTPTTVTLTLPNPVQTTESAIETSPVIVTTETWTTTVTFCKHCGVTGSSITLTVPYTPAAPTATAMETPGAPSGQDEFTVPGGLPQTTIGRPQGPGSSIRPSSSWGYGVGAHSPSQTPTFKIHPSTTSTVQNTVPTSTGSGEGVSPTFNAAGSLSGLMNLVGVSFATVLSLCLLI